MLKPLLVSLTISATLTSISACGDKKKETAPVSQLPWEYEGYNLRPAVQNSPVKIDPLVDRDTTKVQSITYIDPNTDDLVQEIVNRSIVSHPWMIKRISEVLSHMPREILSLSSCTKAFVFDTRAPAPSYFGSVVKVPGIFLAVDDDELSEARSKGLTVTERYASFDWAYFGSNILPWRDHYSTDKAVWNSRRLQQLLTHEFIHACDDKNVSAEGKLISESFPKVTDRAAVSYMTRAEHYWMKDEAFDNAIDWNHLNREHMASIASDAYGANDQDEHIAQIASHYLTYVYSKFDYYEVFYDSISKADRDLHRKAYFGVKNKFCDPRIQTIARDYLSKIPEAQGLKIDQELDCKPEVFPEAESIEMAIKKLEKFSGAQ